MPRPFPFGRREVVAAAVIFGASAYATAAYVFSRLPLVNSRRS